MAKPIAPIYTATQAMLAHAESQRPRAKRLTIREVEEQILKVREQLERNETRLRKAINKRDQSRILSLSDHIRRGKESLAALATKWTELGANRIHQPTEPKPASVRPDGVRIHPERRASPVRKVPV